MGKTTSQRRKTINHIISLTPKIREKGIMKPKRNPKRGKNSQSAQSPTVFQSSNLLAVYEAIHFMEISQLPVELSQKAPADAENENDRISPPLFDESEPSDLEMAPSPTQEQTKTIETSAIDIETRLKTPSLPEEIRANVTQYSDSTSQTEPPEILLLPKVRMVDASTNTESHRSDASTNTEKFYWPMPVVQPEQDELSESDESGSGVSYCDSSESETDLEDFHSDISSIDEDLNIPKTSDSEADVGTVCASPPMMLVFVNQKFHSPESAKLLNNK